MGDRFLRETTCRRRIPARYSYVPPIRATGIYQRGVLRAGFGLRPFTHRTPFVPGGHRYGVRGGRSMSGTKARRRRVVAAVPILALVAAGLATTAAVGPAVAGPQIAPSISDSEYYMNYAEPRAEAAFGTDIAVDSSANRNAEQAIVEAQSIDEKFASGNPVAARDWPSSSPESIKTGKSPKALKSIYKKAKTTQKAKLLTILVEFNPNGRRRLLRRRMVPDGVRRHRRASPATCRAAPSTTPSRTPPTASEARQQLDVGARLLVAALQRRCSTPTTGITERVRTDLTGPDGKPGFDISGYTMKQHVRGDVQGRLHGDRFGDPVGHGAALRGLLRRDPLPPERRRRVEAGAIQDMQGHPSNPLGAGQLPIDAVDGPRRGPARLPLGRLRPRGPGRRRRRRQRHRARRRHRPRRARPRRRGQVRWRRRRGHLRHLGALLGCRRWRGRPRHQPQAVELHRAARGLRRRRVRPRVRPRPRSAGPLRHLRRRRLRRRLLGPHVARARTRGPIFQSMPAHMGIWDKWVLGWADPEVVNPGDRARTRRRSARPRARPRAPRTASRSTCPTRS